MSRDPFAPVTRKQRRRRLLRRSMRLLTRPLRPARPRRREAGPPNLVLIGVDTLRADHLGCYGHGRPTSPHLDRLAGRGTLFTDVTACAPWTLPSFASALTGLMPGLHGAYLPGSERNMDSQPPRRLGEDVTTLAGHLRDQGYRTGAFYSNQFFAFGLAESFDEHRYLNDEAQEVIDEATAWMTRQGDRPFFCFILLNDPHEPTTPRPADLKDFLPSAAAGGADTGDAMLRALVRWGASPAPELGRLTAAPDAAARAAVALKLAIYDATIHQVDRAIGGLDARLEDWGLGDITLRAVFSDHGEEFLDHLEAGRRWDHDPRGIAGIGHGHTLFSELLHVPWLAWGPGVPVGVRRTEPVSLMDLAPTLLDWLEQPPLPSGTPAPGDLVGELTGRSLAAGAPDNKERIILSEALAYGPDLVSARQGKWKIIAHRDTRALALFDLETDPGEMRDEASARPDVVAGLQEILSRWRASGLGAEGNPGDGSGTWQNMDSEIHQRLKDLGYAE